MRDDKVVARVNQMAYAFSPIKKIKMDGEDNAAIILRTREFDLYVRDSPARYHRGLGPGEDLEKWGAGICLLDEWSYFGPLIRVSLVFDGRAVLRSCPE